MKYLLLTDHDFNIKITHQFSNSHVSFILINTSGFSPFLSFFFEAGEGWGTISAAFPTVKQK